MNGDGLRICAVVSVMFLLGAMTGQGQVRPIRIVGPVNATSNPAPVGDGIFLSDVPASMSHNGFGPIELDKSNNDVSAGDGATMTMAGLTYTKGLGVHAPSIITYALNKRCTRFKAKVGVDDEVGSAGSVVFQALVTGQDTTLGHTNSADQVLYTSGTLTGTSSTQDIDIDITGKFELTLKVTDAGDGNAADHADWGFARAVCTTPTGGTDITAGSNIQTALTAGTTGQRFTLKAGVHRLWATSLVFKNNQTLEGELGSILSGGRTLDTSGFTTSGCSGCWVLPAQTGLAAADPDTEDLCWRDDNNGANPQHLCREQNDIFVDNVPYVSVLSQAAGVGTTGKFFIDHTTGNIYLFNDPTQAQVETERSGGIERPFTTGTGVTGVTIQNLTIEKFTGPGGTSDLGGNNVVLYGGWSLLNSEVRLGHGTGVFTSDSTVTRGSYVHHMGFQGFGGCCTGALIETTEISYNNFALYNPYQAGGGSKWVNSDSLIVQDSFAHHNFGPALWTDINNINTIYRRNTAEDNFRAAYFHEISYAATINNNIGRRNGVGEVATGGYGACVQIISSPNVVVYSNTCVDNGAGVYAAQDGRVGPGTHGATTITGLDVYDNCIEQQNAAYPAALGGAPSYSTAVNNFHHNTYKGGSSSNFYAWVNTTINFAAWQGTYGLDTTGSRSTGSCP